MNETQLSQEVEELSDASSFSVIALVGFILSLIGIFSLSYVQTMPVAVIGTLIGVLVLLTAKRFHLNWISRVLGFLALSIGAIVLSWGVFERQISTAYDLDQAKRVSELYLKSLSKGDLDSVYYLVGFQFDGGAPKSPGDEETEMDRAKKRLAQDPAHVEIRSRRNPASWVYVGLEGEMLGTVGYTYKLKYRDEGQTNPPTYWVYARKNTNKYDVQEKVRWFVDTVETVK